MAPNGQLLFAVTKIIEGDSVQELVRLVEDKKINVNWTVSFGVSILLKAVRFGSKNVINYLLSQGANPDSSILDLLSYTEHFSNTSFRYSKQWVVNLLKKMIPLLGDRVFTMTDVKGRNLLLLSCFCADLSIFEYLLNEGVDFSYHDSSILTLLVNHQDHRGSLRMLQQVLNLPTSSYLDIKGTVGSDLLLRSFTANRLDIFFLLLHKGADPFMKTSTGDTLMHIPVPDTDRLLMLYDLGLDVNAVNHQGKKPLEESQNLSYNFFILILLGREVQEEEFLKLEKSFDRHIILNLRETVGHGDFAPTRLQSQCRRCIRKQLFSLNGVPISKKIWQLPLPKPLQLFLDVNMYANSLWNTFV